jgi:hypothetical protein
MEQKTDSPTGQARKVVRVGAPLQCVVCGFELERNLVACSDCDSLYHRDCWDRNSGCAWYACRLAEPQPQPVPARVELVLLARSRGKLGWWAAAAVAVGALFVAGSQPPARRVPPSLAIARPIPTPRQVPAVVTPASTGLVSLAPAPVATAISPASGKFLDLRRRVESSQAELRLVPDGRGGFRFEQRP